MIVPAKQDDSAVGKVTILLSAWEDHGAPTHRRPKRTWTSGSGDAWKSCPRRIYRETGQSCIVCTVILGTSNVEPTICFDITGWSGRSLATHLVVISSFRGAYYAPSDGALSLYSLFVDCVSNLCQRAAADGLSAIKRAR